MHCTRIRARARLGVGSRTRDASAAVWRSAAKRRERARERAEQAGGFPAPWGGGRGVGKNLCNARCRCWTQPRRGLSLPVAVRSGDAAAWHGIVALTWGGPSFFSGCSPDTVIQTGPSGNRQLEILEPEISGSRRRRDTALALARPRGRVSGATIPDHEKTVSTNAVPEVPSLLTLKQAASRLAVCRRTLERLIAAREFPVPLKIGNCSRVPEADVQAYIARLMRVRTEGRAS